jgi:hypothetical protein
MEEENHFSSGSVTYDDYVAGQVRGNAWNGKSLGSGVDTVSNFLTGLPVVGNRLENIGAKAASGISSILNTPNRLINQGIRELGQLVDQGRLGQVSEYGYKSNGDIIPPNTAVPKN